MSKTARRLGRGLDSLVSNLRPTGADGVRGTSVAAADDTTDVHHGLPGVGVEARMVPVDVLHPNPFQPRDHTSGADIASLAASIRQSGILQPISVRSKAGRLEVIAGERRWRAAESIGMTEVPAVVRDATDEQMLEFALIENIQREDLNAIDRAKAYREFRRRFGISPEQLGERLGEDRTTVVNYLRLLDLPEAVQRLVGQGRISMGHARCLLGVGDDDERVRLAEAAAENGLSVRALEGIVRRKKARAAEVVRARGIREGPRSLHLRDLERRFEEVLKTKVTIHEGKRKGTGRIVLEYYSLDDFDRIAGLLGIPED